MTEEKSIELGSVLFTNSLTKLVEICFIRSKYERGFVSNIISRVKYAHIQHSSFVTCNIITNAREINNHEH